MPESLNRPRCHPIYGKQVRPSLPPRPVFAAPNEAPTGGYPLFSFTIPLSRMTLLRPKWRKSGQTQFEFVALLLFDGSPLLLTLRKFAELFGFTERSHQLLPIYGCPPLDTSFQERQGVNSPRKTPRFPHDPRI